MIYRPFSIIIWIYFIFFIVFLLSGCESEIYNLRREPVRPDQIEYKVQILGTKRIRPYLFLEKDLVQFCKGGEIVEVRFIGNSSDYIICRRNRSEAIEEQLENEVVLPAN
jgi:hypothetical protein